jgi:antitoxin component of MazEF toxin-antitoxin module
MAELFRLRVMAGRVVLPPRLMSRLQLSEGAEFEVMINDDNSLAVTDARATKPYTPSPKEMKDFVRREKRTKFDSDFETALQKMRTTSTKSANLAKALAGIP